MIRSKQQHVLERSGIDFSIQIEIAGDRSQMAGPPVQRVHRLPEGRSRATGTAAGQGLLIGAEKEHVRLNDARVVIQESIDDVPILVDVIFPVVADRSPHVMIWVGDRDARVGEVAADRNGRGVVADRGNVGIVVDVDIILIFRVDIELEVRRGMIGDRRRAEPSVVVDKIDEGRVVEIFRVHPIEPRLVLRERTGGVERRARHAEGPALLLNGIIGVFERALDDHVDQTAWLDPAVKHRGGPLDDFDLLNIGRSGTFHFGISRPLR